MMLITPWPLTEARGIRLIASLANADAELLADSGRLQQAFGNILDNAVKFTSAGGVITITTVVEDSSVRIEVKDTGIGIDPDFLPFVFDRLRQAESSKARRFGGLGIGLTIARHVVSLHGGSIQAMSEGSNRGTTFVINLPRYLRTESNQVAV
jgi:signal transduction histidine kinase